jgi:hypothetical protein
MESAMMIQSPIVTNLAEAISTFREPDATIQSLLSDIHVDVLRRSKHIRQPNFTSIHTGDLEFLFQVYDERFFGNQCRSALNGSRIRFRLSRRMTSAGGATTRLLWDKGETGYEIAIATSLLFDSLRAGDRPITVAGVECHSRLEALQRIFEHELIHLAEQLCWQKSDCSAARFQNIAARYFLHRAHTHNMVTRKERAASAGLRIGSRVSFIFEGRQLTGRLNRITKRATVLVEDPNGTAFSDGLRYKTYYVPLALLNIRATRDIQLGESATTNQ